MKPLYIITLKQLNYSCFSHPTEPECAVTDCWAQGSVPINVYLSTPRNMTMGVLEEEPETTEKMTDEG